MSAKRRRLPSPDDSIIASDSEVDEFAADEQGAEATEGWGLYQPDDWQDDGDDESQNHEEDDQISDLRRLQQGLNHVPLETLARAQASLSLAHREQPEAGPSRNADAIAAVRAQLAETRKRKGRSDRTDEEAERIRRDNKHAPTAMSSKKQVTRLRTVVTIPKAERRDPRFSTVSAGHIDPNLHSKGYDFLPGMLRSELEQLKSAVKIAVKAERNCPRAERPARVSERERLENELARMRTRVERTEREARERDVLSAAKKAEAQKRKDGKGEWYMKKSEKRDLLLKSKFNALEERGGKTAVKKAVEKKRKKIASKEKKSRPFAKGVKDDA